MDEDSARKVHRETDTSRSHYGYKVDFSCAETFALLLSTQWRIASLACPGFNTVEIMVGLEWVQLARTTLADNVCTVEYVREDSEDPLRGFRDAANYGARWYSPYCLAIVDSVSDG